MTMPTSGRLAFSMALNECQLPIQRFNCGSTELSRLAGVSPGQRYAFSWWYGKSIGVMVLEAPTEYYRQGLSGANNANFERRLYLYKAGNFWNYPNTYPFGQSGGDDTSITGHYPPGPTNGLNIAGFYRRDTHLTVMAGNNSLDGVTFRSSIGDNVTLTNDISYSLQFGPNLWTFYGADGAVGQTNVPRQYTLQLIGTANRPQPPSGYLNGNPVRPPDNGSGGGGWHGHCFVAGTLVLMADGRYKAVETIEAGDQVLGPDGPVSVKRLHRTQLGERKLLTFREDPSIAWSEEHPFWTRRAQAEWWWSASLEHLRKEIEYGSIKGMQDVESVYTGGDVEYAHLTGFVRRTVMELPHAAPETPLYVPVLEGAPCILNGYVVGAFLNEAQYDYRQLRWLSCSTYQQHRQA